MINVPVRGNSVHQKQMKNSKNVPEDIRASEAGDDADFYKKGFVWTFVTIHDIELAGS